MIRPPSIKEFCWKFGAFSVRSEMGDLGRSALGEECITGFNGRQSNVNWHSAIQPTNFNYISIYPPVFRPQTARYMLHLSSNP